jgi:hypothetical protein
VRKRKFSLNEGGVHRREHHIPVFFINFYSIHGTFQWKYLFCSILLLSIEDLFSDQPLSLSIDQFHQ